MAGQFYTILTAVGKAKIANAAALGQKVELTELALGDGDGGYYNPTENQTELRNEVWRGAIGTVAVDEENPTWITIQTVVPGQHGGFMIREAGVFDDEGDLIAVGKYPETYKPVAADGSIKDLVIRMILEVSNTASVVLKVDPTVILATQQRVDAAEARAKAYTDREVSEVSQALDAHKTAAAPHSGHETPAGAQAKANQAEENAKNYADQQVSAHASRTDNPHNVTKQQVGLGNVDNVQQIPMSQKGQPNGVATLDNTGKIPSSQVPEIDVWKETTPYIIIQSVSAGSTATLLNITSGSGFLLGVEAYADQDNYDHTSASVSITIDGTDKTDGFKTIAGTSRAERASAVSYNIGIAGPLRFNSSIRIQGRSYNDYASYTRWVVTYCLD